VKDALERDLLSECGKGEHAEEEYELLAESH
jgi:hypothetical protein